MNSIKKDIILPDLGEGIDEVEVSEILKSVNDVVQADESIILLESEKATMEIPVDSNGKIEKFYISKGDKIKPGDKICSLLTDLESSTNKKKEIESTSPIKEETIVIESTTNNIIKEESVKHKSEKDDLSASPSVRKLARELKIDLNHIVSDNNSKKITKDDLYNYIKRYLPKEKSKYDFNKWGNTVVEPLTKIRKITADRMKHAWNIPQVTQFDEINISKIEKSRKDFNQKNFNKDKNRITPLSYLIKGVYHALVKYPIFNSSLDTLEQNIILKEYYNIGVAVDSKRGLIVPIVHEVDKMDLIKISNTITNIVNSARKGNIPPSKLSGGTFTISSLGSLGGTNFTPIVNSPEVAILGVSKAKKMNENVILPLSLTYDHRVIDGASAVRFTQYLANYIEEINNFKEIL